MTFGFSTLWRAGCALVLGVSALLCVAAPATAHENLDEAAVARLEASLDYLAGMKTFSLEARSTLEVVMLSGQKIQFDNESRLVVQRPNKLYAERLGDLMNQEFLYDGKTLTLHNVSDGFYASVEAPDSIEGMLDFARDYLDIVAPAGDLIYADAFDILMDGVQEAFGVGTGEVGGVACDHLAFSAPGTDFQIWIQQGDRPLPRKLVITSRDVVNAPQFSIELNEWNQKPDVSSGLFSFKPPRGALEIEFQALNTGQD